MPGRIHGVSVAVIGGSGAKMERDYDFASAVHAADLRDPAEIGRNAGERTVKRLGARKMPTTAFRSCSTRASRAA